MNTVTISSFPKQARFSKLILILLVGIGIGTISPLMLTQFSPFAIMALPLGILSLWLMHQTVDVFAMRRLTIPGFWYLSYLVMLFIPAFYIAANKPDSLAKNNYLFAVESILLTAPLGILIANIIFHFRPIEIKRYFTKPVKKSHTHHHLVLSFLIFLAGALGLMALYVIELPTVPLFFLFNNIGAADEVAHLREDSLKLLDSRLTYAYAILSRVGFPFLIMMALGHYLTQRHLKWLLLFFITLGSGILYAAFTVAKAPVAAIFVALFAFLYLYWGGKISLRWLVIGLVLIFTFPIMVILLTFAIDLPETLSTIFFRLFDDPARQLYSYFEVVPQQLDYLNGNTISFIARLRGHSPFNLTNYVALYDNPALVERGFSSFSANAAFLGDLHANFGVRGVLLGGVLAGFLMQVIQIYLLRQAKTVSNLAVYAFLMLSFWLLHFTTLQTTLLSGGVAFVFLIAWVFNIGATFLKDLGSPNRYV